MSSSSARFEKHICIQKTGVNAVDVLTAETGLSRQLIKKTMQQGAVWLTEGKHTQRIRRAKRQLRQAQTLHIYYDPVVLSQQPPAPTLIADETHFSIWNKPCGLLSQGSKWGDHCTVNRWAEQKLLPQRTALTVHRLDRAANGLIIVAHEKQAAAKLSALFQTRAIDKRYRITVSGAFPTDAATTPLTVTTPIDDRQATSHFSLLNYDPHSDTSLLDVRIETGRKHQIRRHVAELGHPVVGDRLYSGKAQDEDLQLQAYYLAFECPFTGEYRVYDLLSEA